MSPRSRSAAFASVAAILVLVGGRAVTVGQATPASTETAPARVVSTCHVSPIVENLDKAAAFYHDLIGLDLVPAPALGPLPWDTDAGHLLLHGMPEARLRFVGARVPGVRCGVELVEFNNIDRQPVHRRLQDPGAVTLVLSVRDLGAAFARLKRAGVLVVSTGGAPIDMRPNVSKTRAVTVKDPDGHFVELVQVDPLPDTTVSTASNVIEIRLRVTITALDPTLHVYRDLLGFHANVGAFTRSDTVMAMMGLGGMEYRMTSAEVPGSKFLLEFLELKSADGKPIASRVQDPGSYRLQLTVRDIDSALQALRMNGAPVISTHGEPVSMTFGSSRWRLAVVRDPNNLFLVVQQPLQSVRNPWDPLRF